MTESRRTLTEELNSVLRAHALDAPEPSRIIDAVLADAAGRPAPSGSGRLRRLRRPEHLGNWVAAAVVAGLVVGVAAMIEHSDGSSIKASSASGSSAVEPATGAKAAAGNVGSRPSAAAPSASSAASTGEAATVALPPGSATACPGGRPPLSSTVIAQQRFDVEDFYCGATATSPAGSLVEVRTRAQPTPRVLATLVRPAQKLQVAYVSVADNQIIVRVQAVGQAPVGVQAAPSPTSAPGGGNPGSPGAVAATEGQAVATGAVRELTFSADAAFTPTSDEVVAAPCARSAVSATIAARTGTSAAITVVNESASPCALTGYPDVQGRTPTGVVTADHTLSGLSGGVTDSVVPPVVVIQPGGRATAILELTNYQAFCGYAPLTVSLPGIGAMATSAHGYGLCSLQVHPLVEGSTGSSG